MKVNFTLLSKVFLANFTHKIFMNLPNLKIEETIYQGKLKQNETIKSKFQNHLKMGYGMSRNKEEYSFSFPKKSLFDCLHNHSLLLN